MWIECPDAFRCQSDLEKVGAYSTPYPSATTRRARLGPGLSATPSVRRTPLDNVPTVTGYRSSNSRYSATIGCGAEPNVVTAGTSHCGVDRSICPFFRVKAGPRGWHR